MFAMISNNHLTVLYKRNRAAENQTGNIGALREITSMDRRLY